MKFSISFLVVASLSLCALGANIKARSSVKDNCPTAEVLSTTTYNVNGHDITRQTFSCPESGLTRAQHPTTGKSFPSSAIERRNAGECRTAAPECQCGTSFVCQCQDVTDNSPNPNDCSILIDSTEVLAQTEGPTFIVQPDSFELITFQSCGLEFTNFANTPLEYCWDELASTGGLANQVCFQENEGTAAACDANDGLWLTQAIRVTS